MIKHQSHCHDKGEIAGLICGTVIGLCLCIGILYSGSTTHMSTADSHFLCIGLMAVLVISLVVCVLVGRGIEWLCDKIREGKQENSDTKDELSNACTANLKDQHRMH